MKAKRFRTFAGAVAIAAAGVGTAAGAASAEPLPLTEAAPVTGDVQGDEGTGSADALLPLLPLLLSGSAEGQPQQTSGDDAGAATGSADVLLPLLLSGSAQGQTK